MSDDTTPGTEDTAAVHGRSGDEVDDAIDTAAEGSQGGGTLRPPEQSDPGTAPVEQVRDDDQMTTGRDDTGEDGSGDPVPAQETPPTEAAVSGGAQSDPGARTSDRAAADDGT